MLLRPLALAKEAFIHDIIIVGAGCSGLACAKALHDAGKDFMLLEASDRIGGRVHSRICEDSRVGLELGAEFIHDLHPILLKYMQDLQIPFCDIPDTHLLRKNGKLHQAQDFWEELEKFNSKLRTTGKDRSVAEFLEAHSRIAPRIRPLFKAFVEGFQAADIHLMGEHALADAAEGDDELNGARMFRPLLGYNQLPFKLHQSLATPENFRGGVQLKKIDWRPGDVTLTCLHAGEPVTFTCRRLVLTVSLGVLKSGALEWNEMPAGLQESLDAQHMGHVQRLALRFRTRFWENLSDKHISFLHAGPEFYFPTWWTLQPVRTPHLTAWQGGPKAQELAALSQNERADVALKTLAKLTGRSLKFLKSELVSVHSHNWSADPWFQGAYSYIGVDGLKKAARLKRPFADTIYFAGEHTAPGAERGTVGGALSSGLRVAKALMRKN